MMTILLVDVAEADVAILASALRVEGFEVTLAKSASEAREVLASRPVALTILDLMLRGEGGANGLELARELRTDYPSMRVLLTSSYHLSERQLERADCGVSGFIPKPYDVREVVDFVRAKVSSPPSSRRLWCAERPSGIAPRRAHLDADLDAVADEVAAHRR
ncbi:MAG: response regulator [Labilithrix sp.]|nr:response regulator [Labilithrix sp.]